MSPLDPSAVEPFQVVILYEHLSAARLALTAYAHLSRELGDEFTLRLRVWRIDVALLADCTAYAESDIGDADMVIVAARSREACVAACQRWTGKVENPNGIHRQALVAIIDGDPQASPATGTWSDAHQSSFERTQSDVFLWQLHSPATAVPLGAER